MSTELSVAIDTLPVQLSYDEAVEAAYREDLDWIDVRPEPMERYNEEIQRAIGNVAVWQADCNGYYRSPSGRVVTQWPHSMSDFQERTAAPDPDAYESAPR